MDEAPGRALPRALTRSLIFVSDRRHAYLQCTLTPALPSKGSWSILVHPTSSSTETRDHLPDALPASHLRPRWRRCLLSFAVTGCRRCVGSVAHCVASDARSSDHHPKHAQRMRRSSTYKINWSKVDGQRMDPGNFGKWSFGNRTWNPRQTWRMLCLLVSVTCATGRRRHRNFISHNHRHFPSLPLPFELPSRIVLLCAFTPENLFYKKVLYKPVCCCSLSGKRESFLYIVISKKNTCSFVISRKSM